MQLAVFGWQMAAIKYEKDRAADTILPNYNEYGRFDIPSYYENYWQSPEERFYIGLFVIQILCLIASFFLLFAACSLIYGAHTYSRCLVWPWLPCMIASILCTLAYCIMWWTGDVRDYWLVLTILEMITIFINLYCVLVVLLFYRRINGEIAYYNEKEGTTARYGPNMYDEYKKDNYGMNSHLPELEYPTQPGYRRAALPRRDQYTRLHKAVQQQQQQPAPVTPTSGQKTAYEENMVSSWVRQQQALKEMPDHANSEPITPETPDNIYPLKHSYSVPSMYAETSGATSCQQHRHKHRCHHHKHRSGSRSRRHGHGDTSRRRSSSRHRHQSTSGSYSSESGSTDYSEEPCCVRHRSRSRDRHHDNRSVATVDSKLFEELRHRRTRHGTDDRDDFSRYRDRRRGSRRMKRDQRDAKEAVLNAISGSASPTVAVQTDSVAARWPLDPQKGFTFPQQIIIPPSRGSIGLDGRPQSQTYQINSEIRISYDQQGRPAPHEVTPLSRESPILDQRAPAVAAAQPQPQVLSASRLEREFRTVTRRPTFL